MIEAGEPRWDVEAAETGRVVRLRGQWSLLAIARTGGEFSHQLADVARHVDAWDLMEVERLDSAGALLLWRAWGGDLPANLRCREDQRAWFEHLKQLGPLRKRPSLRPTAPLVALGRRLHDLVSETTGVLLLGAQLVQDAAYCARNPRAIPWLEISATLYRAGAQSLLLLAFIGILVGVVLTYQMAGPLEQLGAQTQIVGVVGLAFFRELGPFLTGLIVVARSGSSLAAGVGGMQLTEEIDALRASGVSPTLRVVLPRVVGLALVMPLLVIWNDVSGILGGIYTSTAELGVGYRIWIRDFPAVVSTTNFYIGVGKAIFFGLLIGLVSTYYGLKVERNTRSLTAMTTRSVVVGIALIIAIDGALGVLFSYMGV